MTNTFVRKTQSKLGLFTQCLPSDNKLLDKAIRSRRAKMWLHAKGSKPVTLKGGKTGQASSYWQLPSPKGCRKMGYKLFWAEILAPLSEWEQPGQERGSGVGALTTEEEQSVQMCLGLFNYNKTPVSVCMRECNTMVPQWGERAENPHCLHSAPWNVGVDFEPIKLRNETEATERGNLTLSPQKSWLYYSGKVFVKK